MDFKTNNKNREKEMGKALFLSLIFLLILLVITIMVLSYKLHEAYTIIQNAISTPSGIPSANPKPMDEQRLREAENKGGIANAPHTDFAVGVLTPPLTKGNAVPSGLPYFSIGDPAAS